GYARKIGIDEILTINAFAIEGCMPTMTLYFDITPEEGLQRIAVDEVREQNRLDLEAMDFHQKVYEGYELLLQRFPERIKRIDAAQDVEAVKRDALALIYAHL